MLSGYTEGYDQTGGCRQRSGATRRPPTGLPGPPFLDGLSTTDHKHTSPCCRTILGATSPDLIPRRVHGGRGLSRRSWAELIPLDIGPGN